MAPSPPTSCSSTSTAKGWIPSTSPTAMAPAWATRAGPNWPASWTGGVSTGTPRTRGVGDPRWPSRLRLQPAQLLDRLRPGDPAGRRQRPTRRPGPVDDRTRPDLPAGHGDRIYRQVLEKGWHDKRAAFVQHYDTE